MIVVMNRKGRHKERNRKKEEPNKTADAQELDVEREEIANIVEEVEADEPVEEENIYISDQEEEKREFFHFQAFLVHLETIVFGRTKYVLLQMFYFLFI